MLDLLADLWAFMRERKKFWLAPIILVMVLLGGLLVLAQGSAIANRPWTLAAASSKTGGERTSLPEGGYEHAP